MITVQNYPQAIKVINVDLLSENLKKGVGVLNRYVTEKRLISEYQTDDYSHKLITAILKDLNEFIAQTPQLVKPLNLFTKKQNQLVVNDHKSMEVALKERRDKTRKEVKSNQNQAKRKVPALSIEVQLIKRFLYMDGEPKSYKEVRLYLNALQRAINNQRIRKTSPNAKLFDNLQDNIIEILEKSDPSKEIIFHLNQNKKAELLKIVGQEDQLLAVKLIREYIELHGRFVSYRSVQLLYSRCVKAVAKGLIKYSDKYFSQIDKMIFGMKAYLTKSPSSGYLLISKSDLKGLQGIAGVTQSKPKKKTAAPKRQTKRTRPLCSKNNSVTRKRGLNGISDSDEISSLDFVQMTFDKIGFTGKWLSLIGNPSRGFSAVVYGAPKFGKSALCVDWAGYLARNHGRVLYVAREEGLDDTLQRKLKSQQVAHANLIVTGRIPQDLSRYNFVFLDSVTRLGLKPSDVEYLKEAYPNISFISVLQVTKSGSARGSMEYIHDADVIIEVPSMGFATQYGRFNQGGEMQIFNT